MNVISNYLDVDRFKKDFILLYGKKDDSTAIVLEDIIIKINAAERVITSFLRAVDDIEDAKVQKCCRIVAIAQMYQAKLDYRSGYPYVGTSAYNNVDIITLVFTKSTAVVSKYGELIIDEGEIWLNIRNYYNGGFPIRKVIDGAVSNKYGFLSSSGLLLLPCIFDDCDMHIGESNFIYNNVNFQLRCFGKLSEVDKEYVIDHFDETEMILCCYESMLFVLYQRDLLKTDAKYVHVSKETKEETTTVLRELLADRIISIDKLKELHNS